MSNDMDMDIDYKQGGSPMKGILEGIAAIFTLVAAYVALILASASLSIGCVSPDGGVDRGALTNAIHIVKDIVVTVKEKAGEKKDASSDAGATKPTADTTADGGKSASAPASGTLVYKYGGFHGENAVEDPNTQIKDLHITRSKLTYKWAKGSLKNWGLADDNAHALACASYWDGKQWIGGKFDWISTSRTTRDFNNLDGYNGWRKDLFFAAKKRAFCIVSKDGKKRTNLLETKEP